MTKQQFFEYCLAAHATSPDYPFDEDFETAVLRHSGNRKWFAIVMGVSRRKFGQNSDEVIDVVNLTAKFFQIHSYFLLWVWVFPRMRS